MIETQEATTSATTTTATNNINSSSSNIDTTNRRAGVGGGGSTNGRIETPGLVGSHAVGALCRICMCDCRQEDGRLLESLFRTTVESKSLYAMLVSVCSPLAQANNDGMPDKICTGCKGKLVQAYKLYETCIKSDERIRKLLQTQSFGGVQVKQEVIEDEEDDVEMANAELYYDGHVKREDSYDQDYTFDGQFYGAALAQTIHSTPNLRIQSVRNGPEVLVQLQEHSFPLVTPPKPVFQCEKYVKVTPKGHHCILCGKDFKYFSYFKQHALAQHDPEKPFKCEQCNYTFKTEQRLFIHMRTHIEPELPLVIEQAELPDPETENDPEFEQDQSEDTLDDEDKKDLSISVNADTGEKIYNCLICQKQLTTLPLYRRHRTVHTVRGRPFECDICHYRFAMKFSYNAHMQRHEEGKDPAQPATYKCNECDEIFPKRKLLNIHIAAEHEPEEPLSRTAPAALFTSSLTEGRHGHACPICSETFNRESVLNNHMKTHELEAAQLKHSEICYACTVCGVECESREIFNDHIKTHSDVQFPKDSNTSATVDLSDDEQTPQNGSEDPLSITPKPEGKPIVKCELCHKTFPYACNLKQHKIIHHSELKPHECKVCHYRFEYEGTLLRHMQKHSKSEQNAASTPTASAPAMTTAEDSAIVAPPGATLIYKCKLCSARFQKQKSMTWHLKTHRSIVANEGSTVQELEQSLQSPTPKGIHTGGPQAASSPIPSADTPSQSRNSSSTSSTTNAFVGKVEFKPSIGKGGAMYKCGYCPQNLDSEEAYYHHLKGHRVRSNTSDGMQNDSDSPPLKKKRSWVRSGDHHKCNLCQKVFTFRSQLQQHTALHHQPGKPYECGKCHYSFVHKLNLKRHELTHLEEERLANEEEEDQIKLLEDENFNATLEELVEPVLDEGLANRSSQQEGSETQSSSGDGPPVKRNKCVVCSALFLREDQLIEHLKTHIERIKVNKQETQSAKKMLNEDSDRKCKLCLKVFKFSCQLKQHVQMHHSKDKPFECNICKYRFEFKGHMIRHKANNHADEVAAEEAESDELPAKITTPVVNPDGSEVFQCPACPMNFVKQRSLTWHLKTHGGRKAKQEDGYPSTSSGEVMQCRFCSRTFRDAYELKAHMVTHIGGAQNAPIVDSEHSLFGSGLEMMLQDFPDTMENHSGDPLFDASNLELVLEDGFGSDDLDFNMRYHDTPPLPPAKRSLPINESSSSVYDVAEPGASTTPAKGKIVCDLCKKDFLYACNLKQHMQLHHAKEKPFECKICFYRFEYSGHLVRHIRQNHDSQAESAVGDLATDRSFVCTFCSELFEQKSHLNAHIQTYHRGEKQFKCEMCPASFTYKKSYDTHREEHHSNKRPDSDSMVIASTSAGNTTASSFSCNFCKKTFSSAQKVDNHVCFQ
ncbi:zinc finger protein 845-like isoform X2 [Ochlerotatus camptorhynchus]|uniref:zinc finger protein 845-like isoform X2 n=1 Tax=Ochlerotatus camptorhynchus TaxID=644619 RepID=UPI0031D730E5